MGTSTARITAADFLTPPEMHGLRLAADGAGRIGGARLELDHRCRRAYLAGLYQQVPLRVLPPFQFGARQPVLVYLLNPTAGLLDGDGQLVELSVASGARAVVTGQSATRIHPGLRGFCTQQWRVRVAAGAVLVILPGPALPFEGCRYYQRVAIDLEPGAGLVWGDIWLAGRYQRGEASERFRFATIVQELMVRRGGSLTFRDRFCWQGPWDTATAAWHFGTAPACGSLFVSGLRDRAFAPEAGARFETAAGDWCLRWLGEAEKVTADVVGTALQAGAKIADGAAREPWLLTTGSLAPNHWFTRVPQQEPD